MSSEKTDLAESARNILLTGGESTLATHSVKHEGYPFASITPYAVNKIGAPIFLLSSMATHTKNLKQNPKCSLLVSQSSSNDLSSGRATFIGTISPLSEDEKETASATYLEKFPEAAQWIGFGDFAFYQLEIVEAYIVAGFGAMGWVDGNDLKT